MVIDYRLLLTIVLLNLIGLVLIDKLLQVDLFAVDLLSFCYMFGHSVLLLYLYVESLQDLTLVSHDSTLRKHVHAIYSNISRM